MMAWKMRVLGEDARLAFSQACFICYSIATLLCCWGYQSGRWNEWVLACAVIFGAIGVLGHGAFAFAGSIGSPCAATPKAGAGHTDGLRVLLACHSLSAFAIALTLLLLPAECAPRSSPPARLHPLHELAPPPP